MTHRIALNLFLVITALGAGTACMGILVTLFVLGVL